MIGIISKKEAKKLEKAGYDVDIIDEIAFAKLFDPKFKGHRELLKGDVYVSIYTDTDVYEELSKVIAQEESYKEMRRQEKLRYDREFIADYQFGKASKAYLQIPNNTEVVEHDGWENDGGNRLIKKFYYSNEKWETSKVGSFIVDFKHNSVKVESVHSNT
jgi:hypothetical protein